LEVQQGEGQGGQGGQGGQTENYEYFWSNIREWRSDKDNCVDLPGLYWVLVREPGSECYAYGSIRVRIWDLDDQSNNVWYFGDGAGLDFNPDPNDPNGPVPRPVGHNQNIPAGTTTISDETGQVLFFTDGESVWDLNGNLMANGDSIGGSNQSTQSVLAVPCSSG
jgi:large repetitive protein